MVAITQEKMKFGKVNDEQIIKRNYRKKNNISLFLNDTFEVGKNQKNKLGLGRGVY